MCPYQQGVLLSQVKAEEGVRALGPLGTKVAGTLTGAMNKAALPDLPGEGCNLQKPENSSDF